MKRNVSIGFSLLLFLLLAISCKTRSYSVDACLSQYTSREHHIRDSVYIVDSVLLKETTDTVYLTHTRTLYRDRLRVDTVCLADTVYIAKEIAVEGNNKIRYYVPVLIVVLLLFFLCKGFLSRLFHKLL